jgi:uncharacterized PurR-regulated membrane protein YhhQ (DUF165 family)
MINIFVGRRSFHRLVNFAFIIVILSNYHTIKQIPDFTLGLHFHNKIGYIVFP